MRSSLRAADLENQPVDDRFLSPEDVHDLEDDKVADGIIDFEWEEVTDDTPVLDPDEDDEDDDFWREDEDDGRGVG